MQLQHVIPRILKVNIPEVATKVLKARTSNGKSIFTLSSNLLPIFGFHGDAKVVEELIGDGGQGFTSRLATKHDPVNTHKSVYERTYKSRSANPLKRDAKRIEKIIETGGQVLLKKAMNGATRAHVTIRHGVVTFKPINAAELALVQNIDSDSLINTLVAMTGGVDCSVLEQGGFKVDTLIEFRPQERRDTCDYEELTALSALVNCAPRILCNEDIYTLDAMNLAGLVGKTPITVAHISLQCDDYSPLKTKKQKADSVIDMSSTLDMFIPVLNVLDALKIPVMVVENVQGFLTSPINDVFCLQLKRRGYKVEQKVLDARDFGGHTSRQRLYMVATALDAPFEFPAAVKSTSTTSMWDEVIAPHLDEIMQRDITDQKVMRDAVTSGRLRVITKDKAYAPTITKAQSQATKDSVVIEHNERLYFLPIHLQKKLNCIPESFDIDWMPIDKAAQIIGQSICGKMHHSIMQSVRAHIVKAAQAFLPQGQLSFSI